MNNYKTDELLNQTDIDLKAIEKNPNYLIKKFSQLPQRGKESLIDCLNINLRLAIKYAENENSKNEQISEFTQNENLSSIKGTDILKINSHYDTEKDILDKYCKLSKLNMLGFTKAIKELLSLEPKRRGCQPSSISSMYERLSLTSKVKITNLINEILDLQSKKLKWNYSAQQEIKKSVDNKIIPFPSKLRGCELA